MSRKNILITERMYPEPDLSKDVMQVTPGYNPDYFYIWEGNNDCKALGFSAKLSAIIREMNSVLDELVKNHDDLMNQTKE